MPTPPVDPAAAGHPDPDHTDADPPTMRAAVRRTYGPAAQIRTENVSRPRPGDGEVLLQVQAAGLDRGVWHLTTGKPYLLRLVFGLCRPREPILGLDVAGTVVDVGPAVTKFGVGDEVYGFGTGSFAEFAVASEDTLAPKPSQLTFEQAAVVPISAATALQALVDVGRLQPGHRVLVNGASGGVGTYVVQLACAMGAEVTGVASAAKLDLVRSLGATDVVDYHREDFASRGKRYDLIVDIGGTPRLSRLRRALTPTGTAVLVGGEEGGSWTGGLDRTLRALIVSASGRQRVAGFVAKQRSSDLDVLADYIDAGQLTPIVDSTYPLEATADAVRLLEAGRAAGKIAIVV